MVYLIHFDQPYKHARHYIGYVKSDLEARIERHKHGTGARLLDVVNKAGIKWEVARVWEDGDQTFERKLKNNSHSASHCPICKANKDGQRKRKKTTGSEQVQKNADKRTNRKPNGASTDQR